MRPTCWASLLVLGLVLTGSALVRSSPPDGKHAKKAQPVARPGAHAGVNKNTNPMWVGEAEGWGMTLEDANEEALKSAQAKVIAYLVEQDGSVEWQPPTSYIREKLVTAWEKGEPKEFDGIGMMQHARLRIEIPRQRYDEILQEDREHRAEARMSLAGKALAGLVALLAAVAGYCRLEEATKGYYTTWLRVAAISFVGVVGAGLWWVS